ncbi:hypothetical protein VTI74DRAFT_10981 [Chaetomium olivicolor]
MSSTQGLKARISSPLESGGFVADGHHLPSQVNEALEYASKRLGKKGAHISLLVVRKDYQLPASPISSSPTYRSLLPPVSAIHASKKTAHSKIEVLKQLVRSSSGDGQIRERILHVHWDELRYGVTSPAFSESSMVSASTLPSAVDSTFSHQQQSPADPIAWASVPKTPATPFTVVSSFSGMEANSTVSKFEPENLTQFGAKLAFAHPLSPREEKLISQAFERARKKFDLDPSWLPGPVSPSTLNLPVDLVVKSTKQNERLFSSERLTLLSLDHLYTFRTSLQAYARSKEISRLEDAVDELRRLFLANCRRPLLKSTLLSAYRWLDPINDDALVEVCRMYRRAYGGIEEEDGLVNDVDPDPAWPLTASNRCSGETVRTWPKRMGIMLPHRKPDAPNEQDVPEPQAVTPVVDVPDSLDKEAVFTDSRSGTEMDDHSEISDIEAWYCQIHDRISAIKVDPLRSHPPKAIAVTKPTTPAPPTTTKAAPSPPPKSLTPPPPPPTTASPQPKPWLRIDEADLEEMRRSTPKLRPAPPGRALALKLQTRFETPLTEIKRRSTATTTATSVEQRRSPSKLAAANEGKEKVEEKENEDGDGDHTARPTSAVKSFASARWTGTGVQGGIGNGNGMSTIDQMLHGGGNKQVGSEAGDDRLVLPLSPQSPQERIGPMTPNGYEDISPITRGEWGLLMSGKGKRGGVERF